MKVIIDFSNLAFLSFFGSLTEKNIKPADADETYIGHHQTFINKFQKILQECRRYGARDILFALDSKPQRKYDIFPEYKGKRKKEELKVNPRESLYNLIRDWPYQKLLVEGYEADDIIASYVTITTEPTIVVSTDKDLWALNDLEHVYNLSPYSLGFTSMDSLKDEFGLSKWSGISLYKTLWGDASDNVPNIAPRKQKKYLPLIEQADGDFNKLKDLLASEVDEGLLDRNYALVRLTKDLFSSQSIL